MARIIYATDIEALPIGKRTDVLAAIDSMKQRLRSPFKRLFPDEDRYLDDGTIIYARDKYPRQLEFFGAGALFMERALMAANRVGKTVAGAYEVTSHLSGDYSHWWNGRVFNQPVRAWACGKTNETTRDIVQTTLLGAVKHTTSRKIVDGTGMIPAHLIGDITWKQGVSDFVDTVKIRHASGDWSTLGFKSCQQGRGSFEGTAQHIVWCDEEPPKEIYDECLIRLTTTKGVLLLTFTPLEGLSETALAFMPADQRPEGK